MNQADQKFVYPRYFGPLIAATLFAVLLGAANLVMGDLNQDEGWYLYAALRVADGWLPYRDFAFTQGPMMPLVYALFAPIIESLGVGGGRGVTWFLGMLTAVLAGLSARRLGGASAGVLAFIMIGVNVYHSYYTTVVKTYSLCALFLMVAVYAMSHWITSRREERCVGWLLLTGAGLAAAAATRISSGILFPVFGLWLLFQCVRWGKFSWLWFGIGGASVLISVFLPLYLMAPEGFLFGLIEYHTLRDGGGGLAALVFKGGFISRLVQAYFIPVALLVLMIAAKIWRPFKGTDTGYHQSDTFAFVRLLWIAVIAITLIHLTAPFPYDDYQVPIFPVLAVALAVSWAFAIRAWSGLGFRMVAGEKPGDPPYAVWFVWSVLVLSVAGAFSSPVNQDWMIAGRDRIWWKVKPVPSLIQLQQTAREIRLKDQSGELLTQDTYLAVEAGLKVPRGWEMGPFSYYPDMSDERAAALHLMNRKSLLTAITQSPATFAAVSGYGLAMESPQVKPLDELHRQELFEALHDRFELIQTIPMFGQAATPLNIYRTRKPTEASR